jgi:predicted transcriptional regulator
MRVRKNLPAIDAAVLLGMIQEAGQRGSTTRELAARLHVEPPRIARQLAKLNIEGLIRSGWVPYKGSEAGGPLQVAVYRSADAPELGDGGDNAPPEAPGRGRKAKPC